MIKKGYSMIYPTKREAVNILNSMREKLTKTEPSIVTAAELYILSGLEPFEQLFKEGWVNLENASIQKVNGNEFCLNLPGLQSFEDPSWADYKTDEEEKNGYWKKYDTCPYCGGEMRMRFVKHSHMPSYRVNYDRFVTSSLNSTDKIAFECYECGAKSPSVNLDIRSIDRNTIIDGIKESVDIVFGYRENEEEYDEFDSKEK